jgi:hypothetical protein
VRALEMCKLTVEQRRIAVPATRIHEICQMGIGGMIDEEEDTGDCWKLGIAWHFERI